MNKLIIYIENKQMLIKITLILGSVISSLLFFIETWVWSPFWSLMLIWVIIAADFITGLSVSLKRKEGFHSNKAEKSLKVFLVYTFLLGMVYNTPKINEAFGYNGVQELLEHFPKFTYIYMFSYTFLSFLKNAVLLNLLPEQMALPIYNYIDTYKNQVTDKYYKKTLQESTEESEDNINNNIDR